MLHDFLKKYVMVLWPKPTLPWAIVFVLLQMSTFDDLFTGYFISQMLLKRSSGLFYILFLEVIW